MLVFNKLKIIPQFGLALAVPCLSTAMNLPITPGPFAGTRASLTADYPDPDIIRVTNDLYMVSTKFVASPGLNVLHSPDLVNWEIVSRAATNLDGGNGRFPCLSRPTTFPHSIAC